MAYLLYVNTLLTSIRRIVEFTEQFQRGMTGIERFVEIMDAPVDITDAPDAQELTQLNGEVEFRMWALPIRMTAQRFSPTSTCT